MKLDQDGVAALKANQFMLGVGYDMASWLTASLAAGGTDASRLQALGQDIKWKTMDGSFIDLTVKHAEDIFAAVTDLDAAAFAATETHRTKMEAPADPASYDFSTGWPQVYADTLVPQV